MKTDEFISKSIEDSHHSAARLATDLQVGSVIQLNGDLGSGKTEWVKGLVAALGSDEEVTSPSFALLNEYREGRLPVYHWDLYRLEVSVDWSVLDLPDQLPSRDGVTVVEWPTRYTSHWPESTLVIDIEIISENTRKFKMQMLT
ncbi:MAG: tRNA (adenosine(37)-N6)-threonylcarbamoyltransferase complex ATPase subunit type 1 TsaE [Verrucomicrobiota bacterium]